MTLSTNFSLTKSLTLFFAAFIFVTGCRTANEPLVVSVNDHLIEARNLTIAVLPIHNISGTAAPLDVIKQELKKQLEENDLRCVDDKVVNNFMEKHRIRHTGGINRAIAFALEKETGAEAVFITSLDLYSDRTPPKIALTTRLVLTGSENEILWIDGIGLAGDDSPGILGLSLINDPGILLQKAIENLMVSLKKQLSGQETQLLTNDRKATFQPKVSYLSSGLVPGKMYRVAVSPFYNSCNRKYAGETMSLHFVNHLRKLGNFEVIEPGKVRKAFLRWRIIMDDGISLANAGIIFQKLRADLILCGNTMSYQDYQGSSGKAKVHFSAFLIDNKSREVVWTSKSFNEGDDAVLFFDRGSVKTAHSLASEMVKQTVSSMVE